MHPVLNAYLAKALTADRLEQAEGLRRSRAEWADLKPDPFSSVTVRLTRPGDAEAVMRLAELDGRRVPPAPLLAAEVGGEVLAVRSLASGKAIADPFRPTAHLIELLELRSSHLRDDSDGGRLRAMRRPRAWIRSWVAPSRC
jgi:hypothetical protein